MAPVFTAVSRSMTCRLHFFVLEDVLVHQVLDVEQVLLAQPRVVSEVKAQAVRRDQRTGLLDVRPQRLPQRRVEQVRRGVIPPRRIPPLGIDHGGDHVSHPKSLARHGLVDDQSAHRMIRVQNVRNFVVRPRRNEMARIAHLPARLGIERRVVENNFHFASGLALR